MEKALKELKEILKQKKIRQRTIAERFGVHRTTITKWLNGTRPVTLQNLRIIAEDIAGISLSALFQHNKTISLICTHLERLTEEQQQLFLSLLSGAQPALRLPDISKNSD
jgi:transcriptional regulator with XRE-family HTH domain